MKTFECIGIPDEESGSHNRRETWKCKANSREEALKKAFDHFYYFHEVFVDEIDE